MQNTNFIKLVKQAVAEVKQENSYTETQPLLVPISLTNDQDLNAFVEQVLRWSEQESIKKDIRSGKLRYTLVNGCATDNTALATSNSAQVYTHKLLTEKNVAELAQQNVTHIQMTKGTLVTPSAKDKLKQMNIRLERL